MRKNVFSIFLIVVCSTIMLFSCQNDEVEMSSLSKIELLKAKSKEFAKKYGVDVTLNEDSLAKYAETMTVEDMEADYKSFAELKESVQVVSVPQASPKLKSLSKKSFIRRRKAETETITPDMLDDEGTISSGGTLSKNCCGSFVVYTASATWKSEKGTIKVKLDKVTFDCHGMKCNDVSEDNNIKCTECKDSYEGASWIDVPSGLVTTEGAHFSVSCKIPSINMCMYIVYNIPVEISCSGKAGRIKVNF